MKFNVGDRVKFNVGDRVRFVSVPIIQRASASVGDVVTVHNLDDDFVEVKFDNGYVSDGYGHRRFELMPKYPNPPHKHAELIKAWADGAEIEVFLNGEWLEYNNSFYDDDLAFFDTSYTFRIKPQRSSKDLQIDKLEQQAKDLANEIRKLKG